jgi:serine/threonine protein kinase, bacterial
MFGSSRFMAPEEFELGAPIDQRTNVFVMGREALLFLSDGTADASAFRGSRALFEVAARACEPDRANRYDSIASFYAAWCAAQAA